METSEMTAEILNDLIQINNDRIEGYKRVLDGIKDEDTDLRFLFIDLIAQSNRFKMDLGQEVQVLGGQMETDTTTSGKIYRAWMGVKSVFTGTDRKSILESCEFGEDAAQKAYKTALADDELPAYLGQMITTQQQELKVAHDQIKALRDAA